MFIVLSLFLPFFLGLGLVTLFLFPSHFFIDASALNHGRRSLLLAIVLALGVLLDYLLVLLVRNSFAALVTAISLSCTGFILFILKRRDTFVQLFRLDWPVLLIFIYLAGLYCVPVLLDPLATWDARSIWFLHGKMIYFNKGLFGSSMNSFLSFSHLDYPHLLPVLASQAAQGAGFWNEYLPKSSLLALLIPALLGILSFFERRRISWLFLPVMLPLITGWLLWDGYMDGYLALYGALSLLLLGRWLKEGSAVDLAGGFVFLGTVLNLKNEGTLFALCVILSLSVMLMMKARSLKIMGTKFLFCAGASLWVPVSCFLLWSYLKLSWGLGNDLRLGDGSLGRMGAHVEGGALPRVAKALVVDASVGNALLLVALCLVVVKFMGVRLSGHHFFPLTVALLYFLGIFGVYLATPADLTWHLSTSATRTMLPVVLGIFSTIFFMIHAIERADTKKTSLPERSSTI